MSASDVVLVAGRQKRRRTCLSIWTIREEIGDEGIDRLDLGKVALFACFVLATSSILAYGCLTLEFWMSGGEDGTPPKGTLWDNGVKDELDTSTGFFCIPHEGRLDGEVL